MMEIKEIYNCPYVNAIIDIKSAIKSHFPYIIYNIYIYYHTLITKYQYTCLAHTLKVDVYYKTIINIL